jgi:hypothetical protein
MHFIISFTTITSLSFTFIIILAAPAAKRDYSNIFLFTNSFLNPSADQLEDIKNRAFGTLLNAPLLGKISINGLTNLKLIILNKLFKIVFFTEFITNLTNKVSGYNFSNSYNYIL